MSKKYTPFEISDLYQQTLGRPPTARELAGLGSDINEDYYRKIAISLASSQEGKDFVANRTKGKITDIYKRLVGRDPTADELRNAGTNPDDRYLNTIQTNLAQSQEARDFEARGGAGATNTTPPGGGGTGGGSDRERIDAMLREVQSTDDPKYWYDLAAQHGGLDNTGVEWMRDRINRGDGSVLVRNGTLQKFQDGGGDYGNLMGGYTPFDEQFQFDKFTPPTEVNEKNDPGFDSAMRQIQDTLEHSAAAHGSLLSGNTSRALVDRSREFTLGEYGNLFNRELQTYNTNQQESFNEYSQRRLNHDNQFGQLFALQNASDSRNQFNASLSSQNQNALNNLNFGYAGLGAGLIANGANAANGFAAGAANAGAAGAIGGANAYNSLFGNLAQMPWLAAYLQQQQGAR